LQQECCIYTRCRFTSTVHTNTIQSSSLWVVWRIVW